MFGMLEQQSEGQKFEIGDTGIIRYERELPGYQSQQKAMVQTIHVSEYGSGHVRVRLFVNGVFAGTWIKKTPHFRNIVEWGNWRMCRSPAPVQ